MLPPCFLVFSSSPSPSPHRLPRQAFVDVSSGQTISFDGSLSGMTLTSGQLTIAKNLTIDASALADGFTATFQILLQPSRDFVRAKRD
ncbi:MAG: hypothetical protein VCA38_19620 [Roseibacillus sp.]|jgi:hypothetical protein